MTKGARAAIDLLGRLCLAMAGFLLTRRGIGRGRRRWSGGTALAAALAAATVAGRAAGRSGATRGAAARDLGGRRGRRRGRGGLFLVLFVLVLGLFLLGVVGAVELPDVVVLIRWGSARRELLAVGAGKDGVHELLKDGQVGAVAQQVRAVLLDGNLTCGVAGPQGACQLRGIAAEPQVGGVAR